MSEDRKWIVGVDWGSASHRGAIEDASGKLLDERSFAHDGEGLAALAQWIIDTTGGKPADVDVAIEVPHGPVVESLMEKGFKLFAINPKQLDRFRDRFSPAGAKDDGRDARVGASALRTDKKAFHPLTPEDPILIQLREWSRIAEDLGEQERRLASRMREQLWRYFPQMLNLSDDLTADWMIALFQLAPTPDKARRLSKSKLESFVKQRRIRRFDAAGLIEQLRKPALVVSPATVEAASDHIKVIIRQLVPLKRQIATAKRRLDELTEEFAGKADDSEGQSWQQRDVTILKSMPGIARVNLATLLAEGIEPLRRRDYQALRCLAGAAPVTKQSGKAKIVIRRRAAHPRIANAVFHWARVASQRDPKAKAKYAALRARGHSHGRALRSVGDWLLGVTCFLLQNGREYDPNYAKS